jgi:hypothetical protein
MSQTFYDRFFRLRFVEEIIQEQKILLVVYNIKTGGNEAHPTFLEGGGVYANLRRSTAHKSQRQAQLLGKRPEF